MVKKLFILMALLALVAFGPMSAGANFIDFDDFDAGTNPYTPLNIDGQLIGPPSPNGVTITSADGSTGVRYSNSASFGYITPNNTVSNASFLVNNPMTFTFEVPRGFVAFTGGDNGGVEQDRFTVKLYDINNNNFYSFDSGVFGGNPGNVNNYMADQVHFSYDGGQYAKYMVVEAFTNYGNAGILIDNLEYCHPAPIPGSLVLLGSGILGLVGIGIRRKS